jgi:predicted nucleotidyltransferase
MGQEVFTIQDQLLVDDTELDRFLATAPARRVWPAGSAAVIDEMVQIIVWEYDPLAIILFGSRARGRHRPTSDIDLLVVLPSTQDRMQAALSIGRSLFDAPLPKDVFVTTPEHIKAELQLPSSVVQSAINEGDLLYERGGEGTEVPELAPLRAAGSRARSQPALYAG